MAQDATAGRLGIVPVTQTLLERANAILEVCHPEVPLRSLDAIHLASAELRTYRRDVLIRLHDGRLIEFDRGNDAVHLSPNGAREVETKILKMPLSGDNGSPPE